MWAGWPACQWSIETRSTSSPPTFPTPPTRWSEPICSPCPCSATRSPARCPTSSRAFAVHPEHSDWPLEVHPRRRVVPQAIHPQPPDQGLLHDAGRVSRASSGRARGRHGQRERPDLPRGGGRGAEPSDRRGRRPIRRPCSSTPQRVDPRRARRLCRVPHAARAATGLDRRSKPACSPVSPIELPATFTRRIAEDNPTTSPSTSGPRAPSAAAIGSAPSPPRVDGVAATCARMAHVRPRRVRGSVVRADPCPLSRGLPRARRSTRTCPTNPSRAARGRRRRCCRSA